MNLVARAVMSAVLVAALLSGVGCNEKRLGKYNVKVMLDESLQSASSISTIKVDMVALSGDEAATLMRKPVGAYFTQGDPDRASYAARNAIKSFTFDSQARGAQTMLAKDPVYGKPWDNASEIIVLANLPLAPSDANRRVVIPRWTDRWPRNQEIRVRVREDRLVLDTQPLEPAAE